MAKTFQWNRETRSSLLLTAGVLALFALLFWLLPSNQTTRRQALTLSALEGAVRTGQLSAFSTVYNGVARLDGASSPEEPRPVSYEARVEAALDPSQVSFQIDQEDKTVYMTLPALQITQVQVDESSVDVLASGEEALSALLLRAALQACQADAHAASRQEHAAYAQAEQKARSLLTALVAPVLQELDEGYRLEVR